MFENIAGAVICGIVAVLMFIANIAWTPIIGAIFGLVACALILECLPENKEKATEDVVVEGSFSSKDDEFYHDVKFAGRTGRDLVDPREQNLSEAELKQIMKNAQAALRNGRNVPARSMRGSKA
jgi:Ni,Fe-hydrogenase I small subunit